MSWMVSKKNAIDSPFSALQSFLLETGATAYATDQEKADWIDVYVDQIDSFVFSSMYSRGGSAPHPPAQMFKLTIYQILKQHLSPAKWAREVLSDSILQKLIGNLTPSRTSLYNFRDRVGKIIELIFQRLLTQSIEHEILDPRVGVMDGTSVRSYGSRHRIVNQKTLNRRRGQLADAIAIDIKGEVQAKLPMWMGKTANGRLSQQRRFDNANLILTKRITINDAKKKDLRHTVENIFVSLSDPEAALSRDKEKVFCPMYSAQLLTNTKSLLILGVELSSHATDVGTIGPMIDHVEKTLGIKLDQIYADSAYTSLLDLRACLERKVEVIAPVQENSFTKGNQSKKVGKQISRGQFQYNAEAHCFTCPAGHTMPYTDREVMPRANGTVIAERFRQSAEKCQACPLAKQCLGGGKQRSIRRTIGQEIIDQQKAKMTDEISADSRALRAQTIERTNAELKQRIGLRRLGAVTLKRAKNFLVLALFVLNLMTVRRLLIEASKPNLQTT